MYFFSINRHVARALYFLYLVVADKFPKEVFYYALQREKKFVSGNTTKERNRSRIFCLSDNYIISTVCGHRTPLFT